MGDKMYTKMHIEDEFNKMIEDINFIKLTLHSCYNSYSIKNRFK